MLSLTNIRKRIGIRVLFALLTLAFSVSILEQAAELLRGNCDIELVEKPVEEKGEKFEKEFEKEETEKEKILQFASNSHHAEKQKGHNIAILIKQNAAFGEIVSPPPEFHS